MMYAAPVPFSPRCPVHVVTPSAAVQARSSKSVATAWIGTMPTAIDAPANATRSFVPLPPIGLTSCPKTCRSNGVTLNPTLGEVEAVPVRVLAVDVDDPLQPSLLEKARGDARAIAGRAVHRDGRVVGNLVRAAGDVRHVDVHRARNVT